jgi:predicted TIM-barrel enzyme
MTLQRNSTRLEILAHLRATIAAGRPILGAGCSAGLIARSAEAAGADLIIVYSTGKSRLMGLPTTTLGDSNTGTVAMYREIHNVVEHTPIIGGMEMCDPQFLRIGELLDLFQATGFNGIINLPTIADRPKWAAGRSAVGLGLEREYAMVKLARERDYLTLGYALDENHARGLAEAGVDIMVPHAGWTVGGLVGAGKDTRSLEEGAAFVQHIIEISRAIQPDCIFLAHGGPFGTPADTAYLYQQTDAQGFVGASSIERMPVERAVMDVVAGFKNHTLRPSAIR